MTRRGNSFKYLLKNIFYLVISRFCEFVDLQRDEEKWVDDLEDGIMTSVRRLLYSLQLVSNLYILEIISEGNNIVPEARGACGVNHFLT